jgi:hypothetical protein
MIHGRAISQLFLAKLDCTISSFNVDGLAFADFAFEDVDAELDA